MFRRAWIPAAVAAAAIAAGGNAQAQQTGVNGGFTTMNNGFAAGSGLGTNSFNNGGFVDPRFVVPTGNAVPTAVSPGFANNTFFNPGFGGGFVPAYYGPMGYYGPNYVPQTRVVYQPVPVPVAVNTRPARPQRVRIIDGGSGSGYDYASRARADALARTGNPALAVGGRSQESEFGGATQGVETGNVDVVYDSGETRVPGIEHRYGPEGITNSYRTRARDRYVSAPRRTEERNYDRTYVSQRETVTVDVGEIDPQQVRLANHMENVMEDRPLTEGTVIGKDEYGILVQYQVDGATRTRTFAPGDVFFFGNGTRVKTAGVTSVAMGTDVLVPVPAMATVVRQSVAGSRQEMSTPTTRTRVMGSRTTTRTHRTRRPAK
jgi:hypothetical protein